MAGHVDEILERLRVGTVARHHILWELKDEPETRDALRAVRRHGPGRLRGAALDALMYLGGEAALDSADVAAVERLIRVRRLREPAGPVVPCETQWWCVRSHDQAAVMATVGLVNPRPVTVNLASCVLDIIDHEKREKGDGGLVYVSPAINGWVSVVGPWCDAFGDRRHEVRARVERLSAEYGEAHAFYFGARSGESAWMVARDGVTVRRYSTIDDNDATGDPLPIEQDWMAAQGIPGRPEQYRPYDDEYPDVMDEFLPANEIAAAISIDVGRQNRPEAVVRGFPVLASRPPRTSAVTLPPGLYDV
jgi:hypothetical protein